MSQEAPLVRARRSEQSTPFLPFRSTDPGSGRPWQPEAEGGAPVSSERYPVEDRESGRRDAGTRGEAGTRGTRALPLPGPLRRAERFHNASTSHLAGHGWAG
jgi:hypothetical protein